MKKVFLFLSVLLCSIVSFSQIKISTMPRYSGAIDSVYFPGIIDNKNYKINALQIGGGGSGVDSIHSIGVSSVSNLKANGYQIVSAKKKNSSDKILVRLTGYYTPGDGGGGEFYWNDTSTKANNNGTVIKPTGHSGNGAFERILNKNEINVLWFGAKPSNSIADAATNGNAFRAALRALPRIVFGIPTNQGGGQIYIPRGKYFLDSSIRLDGAFIVRGDAGGSGGLETMLIFGYHSSGIIAQPVDPVSGRSGGSVIIENIGVSAYYLSKRDTTAHGFEIKGQAVLRNCYAEHWPGDGFNFDTDAATPGVQGYGNSAFAIVEGCRAYDNRHGFYTHGGDANVLYFNTCDATGNRRWGFREDGFLGNTYNNCHVADNTFTDGNKALVSHNGKSYVCIFSNTGIEPGVTLDWKKYWFDMGNPFQTYFQPWHVDSAFYSGGGYNSWPGLNGNNMFLNCYSEGGQLSLWGQRTMVIGGDLAAAELPDSYADMRFEASGDGYNFRTYFQYSDDKRSSQSTRIGASGLQIFPHSMQTNWYYPLAINYDTIGKEFNIGYANSADYNSIQFPSTIKAGTEYGLPATNLPSARVGIANFPRGATFGTSTRRLFTFATSAPLSGSWAVGDFVMNAATGSGQALGWRCVDDSPLTWETLTLGGGGGASGWELQGNTGTSAEDFIGTTDEMPLQLKAGAIERLRLNTFPRVDVNGKVMFNSNPQIYFRNDADSSNVNIDYNGSTEFVMRNSKLGGTTRLEYGTGGMFQLLGPGGWTLVADPGGNIGIGTISPSTKLDIDGNTIRLRSTRTITSPTDAGNAGEICYDANYIYVCVAANTWKRFALSTW
jgi:hypothetical protein